MQHARINMLAGILLRNLRRSVVAVVVNNDDLGGVRLGGYKPINLFQARRQAAGFVVRRNNDRQKG